MGVDGVAQDGNVAAPSARRVAARLMLPDAGLVVAVAGGLGYLTALASIRGVAAAWGVTPSDLDVEIRDVLILAALWIAVPAMAALPFYVATFVVELPWRWYALVGALTGLAAWVGVRLLATGGYAVGLLYLMMTLAVAGSLALAVPIVLATSRLAQARHNENAERVDAALREAEELHAKVDHESLLIRPDLSRIKNLMKAADHALESGKRSLEAAEQDVAVRLRFRGMLVVRLVIVGFITIAGPILAHEASREWASDVVENPVDTGDGPIPLALVLQPQLGEVLTANGELSCLVRVGGDVFLGRRAVVVEREWTRFTRTDCDLVDVPFRPEP